MENFTLVYNDAILDAIKLVELRKVEHNKFMLSHSFSDISKFASTVYLQALTEISCRLKELQLVEDVVNKVEQ